MKPILALLLIPTLAVVACGGGGSSAPLTINSDPVNAVPSKPAVESSYHPPLSAAFLSTPQEQRVVHISAYGDSTIYGSTQLPDGTYTQSPDNEPASLQRLFDQDFGPGKVIVTNHGVPGSTAPELLWGQAPVKTPWAQELAGNPADLIVVNEAINDSFLPAEMDTDFAFCYGQLGRDVKAAGKGFIIEGPNPITFGQNARLQQLANDEQQVAIADLGVPYVPMWQAVTSQYANWQAALTDGVHPNGSLYRFKATVTYSVLKPIVQWMLAQ